jgi:dihydroorotate dehydrogenase
MDPDYLAADILRAREGLSPGQALCVSVFGFGEDPLASFQRAAGIAVDAGAALIEANLSCPNVSRGEGALYLDPEAIALVTRALKSVLGSTPLILKMGAFSTEEAQRSAFLAAARSGAQAISGINTIVGQIMRPAGGPALGPDRPTGGVCGAPIRDVGLSFTRRGRRLIEEEGLDLGLIAVGGVMCAEHAIDYLAAGADIVQSATGMMWDPYLAQKFHQARARKMELVHG